jgi:hypothetical protein
MEAGEGEFGPLLLHAVGAAHGVHPQSPLQHQPLAHLNPVLQILGQAAPAHHPDLARGVIRTQPIEPDAHLGHGGLVVLGVADLGCLQHLHLQ